MIINNRLGGRTIELYIPFEYNGKRIDSITFAPLQFGHSLRWQAGDWTSMLALMIELAGVDEPVIRSLRFPDADRVMETFIAYVTPEMRADITEGRIPLKQPEAQAAQQPTPPTNGGQPPPLGVPLPEEPDAAFDLSDEP